MGRWRLVGEAGCGVIFLLSQSEDRWLLVAAGGGGVWLLVTLSLATAQLRGQFLTECNMTYRVDYCINIDL